MRRFRFMIWLMAGFPSVAMAQITWVPAVGFTKDYRTETENYWKPGLNLSLGAFKARSEAFSFGVRAALSRWSVDGQSRAAAEAESAGATSHQLISASGSVLVIEVTPSVKFRLLNGRSGALHIQAGIGFVHVGAHDVTISGTYVTPFSSGTAAIGYETGATSGIGLHVALPVTIARRFLLIPNFSGYHTNDRYAHFGVAIGAAFGG